MNTTATSTPPDRPRPSFRRRSQRIPLAMYVEVSGRDANNESFTFTTTATNLNRNGATLHVNRDLPMESIIVLKNSRGARRSARIVARVNIVQDLCSYGVEFQGAHGAEDFWGISFPTRWLDRRALRAGHSVGRPKPLLPGTGTGVEGAAKRRP